MGKNSVTEVQVWVGDITRLKVVVLVNAANSELAGGGGVDGAIHRAAGYKELRAACALLGGCPTGEVRLTDGFGLPARAIIHAVGPVWQGGDQGEPEALRSCYREAMGVAEREGFESIAFPSISCGVYGYPHEAAVDIAVDEVRLALTRITAVKKVIFCCFGEAMAELYRRRIEIMGI
ncbi:MAG: O-acetyl-ADP-ribose deacetylase [Gammaproteobacteria bacterium]|nr:MAG: O-acetyl-ADP-ribose deacetylase [Gammaproteobacteria bacterium]